LGNEILCKKLSKFEADILMNDDLTIEEMERGFKEAKNIIDKDGNIDSSKIEKSTLFNGDTINIPAFEDYIEKHPEYKKTYDIWKKLNDNHFDLLTTDLKAFRNSISIERVRELRNFLMNYKKTQMKS